MSEAKPMPLKQAMREARAEANEKAGCECADGWLIEYHRALAARGWPLTPPEATEEMCGAGFSGHDASLEGDNRYMAKVYRAMRSALPAIDELLKEEK